MKEKIDYANIPKEEFSFVDRSGDIHDKKFETKPIGYFKDVWLRFCRNKSSVVAAVIILILVLYAIFVPIFCETSYSLALTDTNYLNYTKLVPKIPWLGVDGTSKATLNASTYLTYKAMGEETGMDPIVEVYRENYEDPTASKKSRFYDVRLDNYYKMGMTYLTLTPQQYEDIQVWQDQTGIQDIYPAITDSKQSDANIWYQAD